MFSLKPFYLPAALAAVKWLDKGSRPPLDLDYGINTHKRYQRIKVPSVEFPVSYNYHLHRTNSDVLVIFCHGLLSSEAVWFSPDFFSTDKWLHVRSKLNPEPTCLSISLGMCWLLYPAGVKRWMWPTHATAEDFFFIIQHLMKEHELNPSKIILIGSSMGGFNAAQLLMSNNILGNPMKIDKAILHVPMIPQLYQDPFNWFDFSFLSAPIIRGHFDKPAWNDGNPFTTLQRCKGVLPPTQIHVSQQDEFNLYQGGKGWYNLMKRYGHPVELCENPGGHKDLNVDLAADFIRA